MPREEFVVSDDEDGTGSDDWHRGQKQSKKGGTKKTKAEAKQTAGGRTRPTNNQLLVGHGGESTAGTLFAGLG